MERGINQTRISIMEPRPPGPALAGAAALVASTSTFFNCAPFLMADSKPPRASSSFLTTGAAAFFNDTVFRAESISFPLEALVGEGADGATGADGAEGADGADGAYRTPFENDKTNGWVDDRYLVR